MKSTSTTIFEQSNGRLKIVCIPKPFKQTGGRAVIRIDENAYSRLTKLANEANTPLSVLASELIRFGIDKADIIERKGIYNGKRKD